MTIHISPAGILLLAAVFGLSGCGSIAKGVTEAILEKSEEEDTRACHVEGPVSKGIQAYLNQQTVPTSNKPNQTLKVLMIHGIGKHIPGYSARLTEHLTRELSLEVREDRTKEFSLSDPKVSDDKLGALRVSRFLNKEQTQEMLFYELTWSNITEEEKKVIAFDDSTEYSFRRSGLNSLMKQFFNSHIPDPLIYLGEAQLPILTSVQQSFCWMTSGDWDDYPYSSDQTCNVFNPDRGEFLNDDDFVVVTHSLGSRIILDTAQQIGDWGARQTDPQYVAMRNATRDKTLRIYMLANQLPLLELGRAPAKVVGEVPEHCIAGGRKRDKRFFDELSIYAFSDPNDILSYPVPANFVNDYMDSRLCPKVTNVTINVAKPISLFGFSDVASPLEAHSAYDHDDRVIALIANGIGHSAQSPLVKDRCTWLETTSQSQPIVN